MSDFIVVLTTTDSRDEAETIASTLVEEKLAACVQMMPINSVYEWNGRANHDEEILLLAKTRERLYEDVEARITALHSYDEPEIIACDITAGSPGYLSWVAAQTTGA